MASIKASLTYPLESDGSIRTLAAVGLFYWLGSVLVVQFTGPWGLLAVAVYPVAAVPLVGYGIRAVRHVFETDPDKDAGLPAFWNRQTLRDGVPGVLIWTYYVGLVVVFLFVPAVLVSTANGTAVRAALVTVVGFVIVMMAGQASMIRLALGDPVTEAIHPRRTVPVITENAFLRAWLASLVVGPILAANAFVTGLYETFGVVEPLLSTLLGLYSIAVIWHLLGTAMRSIFPTAAAESETESESEPRAVVDNGHLERSG